MVVGATAATPHRAMTGGSPQAATPGEPGSVSTRFIPLTVVGNSSAAEVQAGWSAAEGTATSTPEEHADSTTAAAPSAAAVEWTRTLVRRGPPCR